MAAVAHFARVESLSALAVRSVWRSVQRRESEQIQLGIQKSGACIYCARGGTLIHVSGHVGAVG
ncbi:MAG: hypothetical protein DME01_26020 [Candidatus Rokuibacteriota bacterium]|nr:MAG: hypothetical protein DME01_26020 [Candidatus Rokubacteria bacterium]